MKTQYCVRNWDDHFENSQSRKVNRLNWVAIPNKHDGKSYRRLISMPDGPSIYAAWLLLLQVASKCPNRGVLADEDGPLDEDDLAAKTGCPVELFAAAFDVLSNPRIGWLDVETPPATGSELAACSQSTTSTLPACPDVSSLKGTEQNNRNGTEPKKGAADAAGGSPKTSKRKPKAQEPVTIPDELDTESVRVALDEFREHRRQLKKPLTALAESKLLTEWSNKGSDRFVAAVNHSIARGWQGVFEQNETNGTSTGTARRSGTAPGRIQAPAGKYDDDSDVIDLTVREAAR
jgi:hypothetical protein